MKKRTYIIEADPNELKIAWGRCDIHSNPSVVYTYGGDQAKRNHILNFMETFEGRWITPNLTTLLKKTNYDLTTLKMIIRHSTAIPKRTYSKKQEPNELRITCIQNNDASYALNYITTESEEFNEQIKYYFEELDVNNMANDYIKAQGYFSVRPDEEKETLFQMLENNGYDLNTFMFSIQKNK